MTSRRTFRTVVGSVLAAGLAVSLTAVPAQAATGYACLRGDVGTVFIAGGMNGVSVLEDARYSGSKKNSEGVITACKYTGTYVVYTRFGTRSEGGTKTVSKTTTPWRYAV